MTSYKVILKCVFILNLQIPKYHFNHLYLKSQFFQVEKNINSSYNFRFWIEKDYKFLKWQLESAFIEWRRSSSRLSGYCHVKNKIANTLPQKSALYPPFWPWFRSISINNGSFSDFYFVSFHHIVTVSQSNDSFKSTPIGCVQNEVLMLFNRVNGNRKLVVRQIIYIV